MAGNGFPPPYAHRLGAAYLLTSLFGAAIIIIAAGVQPGQVEGYNMILSIASTGSRKDRANLPLGVHDRFLGAVFSSMLGVWDGVPYLFADFVETYRNHRVKRPARQRFTPVRRLIACSSPSWLSLPCCW
ncbi:MAG: hypothetical protein H6559_34350 [Lewinellaceae bacterium]|nr:hypothetical protein [Lewinellaceae bacterium]